MFLLRGSVLLIVLIGHITEMKMSHPIELDGSVWENEVSVAEINDDSTKQQKGCAKLNEICWEELGGKPCCHGLLCIWGPIRCTPNMPEVCWSFSCL